MNKILTSLKKFQPLNFALIIMAALIVIFNVKGYDVLFNDDPLIPFIPISPLGVLLACTEIAVLLWISEVIKKWSIASRILKLAIFIVVPAFWFLCYAGINSYLESLATAELRQAEEVKTKAQNNDKYLATLENKIANYEKQLTELRSEQQSINEQIITKSEHIKELDEKASARRFKTLDCSAVSDCANSVAAFTRLSESISLDVDNLKEIRKNNTVRIARLEENLEFDQKTLDTRKLENIESINEFAGVESDFALKKAGYENSIKSILEAFGIKIEKPFPLFMMVLSGIIYPVYFLLNLKLSLDSEENRQARQQRLINKQVRQKILTRISSHLRTRTLRNKKARAELVLAKKEKLEQQKSARERAYQKLLKYFRVWAHRRKKTKTIEVEKIVELPTEVIVEKTIEVEKIIEKEVLVDKIIEVEKVIEKEVVITVDRIVEVPTEVPVYIDKIKKVPEPMFIKDPQIIIHERIIPVPADITGHELEEFLNAQPGLNTAISNSKNSTDSGNQSKQSDNSSGNNEHSRFHENQPIFETS